MSHYRKGFFEVAVFQTPTSPDIDGLMAQYSEESKVDPYLYWTREEALAKARKATTQAKSLLDRGYGEYWQDLVVQSSHIDDSDDDILAWFATECDLEVDDEGNFLSTYNPNSRWHHYQVIVTCSLREWLRRWLDDRADMTDDALRAEWAIRSKEFPHIAALGDEDTYVKYCRMPAYDGVIVTPDGKWHDCVPKVLGDGKSTIWTDEELDWIRRFRERFVEPYDLDETMVSIIECVTYNAPV